MKRRTAEGKNGTLIKIASHFPTMEILIIIIKIITEQVNLNELSLKLERLFRTFFSQNIFC